MTDLKMFDSWLIGSEFAALTGHQPLESVNENEGVIFPPTFAPPDGSEGQKGDYNIDHFEREFSALIESVRETEEDVSRAVKAIIAAFVAL